jgi:hypothetical protein
VSTYQADPKAVAQLSGLAARGLGDGGEYREICAVLEHERIAFQSFPYEWAPEMLYAAGALTLDLAESALAEGFGLKDATLQHSLSPTKPVFVDPLSFWKTGSQGSILAAHAVRSHPHPAAAGQAAKLLALDRVCHATRV